MQKIQKLILGGALVAALMLTPAIGYAHDKENKNNGFMGFKNFGQFVASFVRQNGEFRDDDRDGRNGDENTQKPVISNLRVTQLGTHHAVLTWQTDVRADSSVWFGTTSPVNVSGDANISLDGKVRFHRVVLRGLEANTQYFARVGSAVNSESTISSEISFTTLREFRQPVISNIQITNRTASGATITFSTNEMTTAKLFLGTTTPVNTTSAPIAVHTDFRTNHSLALSNLSANTNYFLVIMVTDRSGNVTTSGEISFSTTAS